MIVVGFFFFDSFIKLGWRNFFSCEKKKRGWDVGRGFIFENLVIYLRMKEFWGIFLDSSGKDVYDYSFNIWFEYNL